MTWLYGIGARSRLPGGRRGLLVPVPPEFLGIRAMESSSSPPAVETYSPNRAGARIAAAERSVEDAASGRRDGVRIPASALRLLAAGAVEAGPDAVRVLREAGRRTGVLLYEELGGEPNASRLSPAAFVEALNRVLAERGLGVAAYSLLGPGVAELSLRGSPETAPSASPGCSFASGWIGGLMSRAAGARVAVLEIRCGGAGPEEPCRFLLGSADRLRRLRRGLERGEALPELAHPIGGGRPAASGTDRDAPT